jgi:hypothetical protein
LVEHTKKINWLWLLLLLPVLGGLWWGYRNPTVADEPSPRPPISEIESKTSDEPKAAEEPPLPPPRLALPKQPPLPPPTVDHRTATRPQAYSSSTNTGPASGELSDDAIAALSADTIAMLNSHKYWTPHGLVDGLYDVWLNKRQQGLDVADVRQQIAWALKGAFMESY